MTDTPKRWKARITIGESSGKDWSVQTTSQYGGTLNELRVAARAYLLLRNPVYISNVGDHIIGEMIYFYVDSKPINNIFNTKSLEKGRWYCERKLLHSQIQKSAWRKKFDNFDDALDHFIEFALIPEKGPDYRSKAIVGNVLQLPLLEQILREAEEHPINDLIQRGWHIIALEYKGELSLTGEITNRRAIFVMGHPEVQFAQLVYSSEYHLK